MPLPLPLELFSRTSSCSEMERLIQLVASLKNFDIANYDRYEWRMEMIQMSCTGDLALRLLVCMQMRESGLGTRASDVGAEECKL